MQIHHRLSSTVEHKLHEHTRRFESAAGGEEYVPAQEPDQLQTELARWEAAFKKSERS